MPKGIGLPAGKFGTTKAHMPPLGPERTREILKPYEKPKHYVSPLGLAKPKP